MALILHIESSSSVCSVALSNKTDLIACKELDNGYTHAENLHVFIEQLLSENNISASQLNAIAVSSGPGSYTGLRIGYSAAKGLAYALNIPLIAIDTLQAMCVSAKNNINDSANFCPMLDARRMEVYCSVYGSDLNNIKPTAALVLDDESILQFETYTPIYFFGDGMPKAKELLSKLNNAYFLDSIKPSSKAMIKLAYDKYQQQLFEDTAYAEPFYLKEFFFQSSKK